MESRSYPLTMARTRHKELEYGFWGIRESGFPLAMARSDIGD